MSMRYPGGLIATTPVNQQFPSGVWTGPQTTPYQANNVWGSDPYFRNTSLLLQGGGSVAPFNKDSSANNFNVAINGDTRASSYTPFQGDGYYSNYFDGSGDYLTLPNATTLALGTSDFTVEGWFNFSSSSAAAPYYNFGLVSCYENQSGSSGFTLAVSTSSNSLNVGIGDTNLLTTSFTISVGTWYHFAVSRSSGTIRLFINGALATSASNSSNFTTSTNPTSIGSINVFGTGNTMLFTGYASNVRIVKGTAVYTSAFTPSTTPLTAVTNTALLTCQSNRFIDNSTNAYTITKNGDTAVSPVQPFTLPATVATYGSGYFDGSGDYLSVSAGNNAFLMSGDWTLACWIYPSTVSGVRVLIDTRKGSSSGSPVLYTNGTNLVIDTGSASVVSAGTIATNQWQHVAATRSGNSWRLYLNGSQIGSTTTNTTTYSTEYGVWIGNSFYSEFFSGYMSNVQILNGTALYTGSTYTVPINPLAGIANTSLLTLQSSVPVNNNTLIPTYPTTATMIRGASITQGLFSPFITNGYWSNYFDGSGDYLTCSSSATNVSTASFTIEFWVNFTSLPSSGSNYNIISATVTNGVEVLYRGTGSFIEIGRYGVGPSLQYSWVPPLGVWNHVAFVRNGTTVNIYINGTSVASGTVSQDFQTGTTNIGSAGGTQSYFAGYLSNMRVVKSTAVYTSNFIPSITPLTAVSNTSLLTCQSNRFLDNSTNAFAITKSGDVSVQAFQPFPPSLEYTANNFYGSASLVSGDYFQVAGGSPTSIGNFSASAWIYRSSVSGSQQTFCSFGEEGPGRGVFFWTGSNFEYNIYGSSSVTIDGTGSMPVGAWTYVVLTRTGSTLSLYYNGSLKNSVSLGTAFTNTSDRKSGYGGVIGYVANYRLDYAAYPSPTTVPTAPVSYTASTLLLANFTNAGIYDSTGQNNLVTVGNSQLNTSVVKYGTGSMYFDGNGDYLTAIANAQYAFQSGDFTIEMWVNPTTVSAVQYLIDTRDPSSTTSAGVQWFVSASAKFGIYVGTTAVISASTTSLVANIWTHLALVKRNGAWVIYVNGIADATTGSNTTSLTQGFMTIACSCNQRAATTTDKYSGYIDDLRVTKGVARYVTNFTPPVARMPNQ